MIKLEAYSELQPFAKMVNGLKKITFFKRNSILEVFDRQDFEYASANIFQLYPKNTFYC